MLNETKDSNNEIFLCEELFPAGSDKQRGNI